MRCLVKLPDKFGPLIEYGIADVVQILNRCRF